eukprot:213886_1
MGCRENLPLIQFLAGIADFVVIITVLVGLGGLENHMTACCGNMGPSSGFYAEDVTDGITVASYTGGSTAMGKYLCVHSITGEYAETIYCECRYSLEELEVSGEEYLNDLRMFNGLKLAILVVVACSAFMGISEETSTKYKNFATFATIVNVAGSLWLILSEYNVVENYIIAQSEDCKIVIFEGDNATFNTLIDAELCLSFLEAIAFILACYYKRKDQ